MGLDQYLEKEIYIAAEYEHRNVTGNIDIYMDGNPVKVNFKKVSKIIESAFYWRKANQIHNWFVKNVQKDVDDCGRYYVTKENFEKLLQDIDVVLENNDKADEVLPTAAGFFFGSTEYNRYYYDDLLETKEFLECLLKDFDENCDFYYHSSW